MKITEYMISAAPLLEAVRACERDQLEATNVKLAELTGRSDKNIPRQLTLLAEAGWISRETGSRPALTDAGREVLAAVARANGEGGPAEGSQLIPLHLIDADPDLNPRGQDADSQDEEADADLTASIGDKGVLQPIKVRPSPIAGRYRVVMGWRRWKCAIAAGLLTIPAQVEDLTDDEAFEQAVAENEQRADMNPLDKAKAYRRTIDRFLAANPAATMKEAKAYCARVVGNKSARTVELHLQLEQLPPIKQIEVRQGKTGLKDAIAWMRSQPKVAQVGDDEWLLALEVLDRTAIDPAPKEYEWRAATTACGFAMTADPRISRGWYDVTHSKWADGAKIAEKEIGLNAHAGLAQLALKFPDLDLDSAEARAAKLAELRAGLGLELAPGARYTTEWLNGPFVWPAEALAEIAASNLERAAQRAEDRERTEARQAQEAATQARVERDNGEHGLGLLACVRQLEQDWTRGEFAAEPEGAFRRRFAEAWALAEVKGPFSLAARDNAADPTAIVAADGEAMAAAGPALEAKRRLIAIALNYAAGLAPVSGPAFPTPWAEGDLGEAWRTAQNGGNLDFLDDDDDAEAEDDLEDDDDTADQGDEAEAEAGDEETSPALLRLAGVRSAEARPAVTPGPKSSRAGAILAIMAGHAAAAEAARRFAFMETFEDGARAILAERDRPLRLEVGQVEPIVFGIDPASGPDLTATVIREPDQPPRVLTRRDELRLREALVRRRRRAIRQGKGMLG